MLEYSGYLCIGVIDLDWKINSYDMKKDLYLAPKAEVFASDIEEAFCGSPVYNTGFEDLSDYDEEDA